MFSHFSPEWFLYYNLGVFEAMTTTNGNRELEFYSLCKAQLSVVYDEVQRNSGKNLYGSSNTDALKMKVHSSIKCLIKFSHTKSFKHFHILCMSRSVVHYYPVPSASDHGYLR